MTKKRKTSPTNCKIPWIAFAQSCETYEYLDGYIDATKKEADNYIDVLMAAWSGEDIWVERLDSKKVCAVVGIATQKLWLAEWQEG